ncbi:MAG: gliding motility-associated C-terminal domain-containing protein [Chitinophagaceae bacterium]|nr:MAG: gliding motility-associated C-terminal domain-containing protein [Chitinophagaceae bacterium]
MRSASSFFNGLVLANVNNVEIYGLYFENFNAPASPSISQLKGAIFLAGSANITIGAPNMGNAFADNYAGIYAPLEPQHELGTILIQSNYFGLKPDGSVGQLANRNGIDVSYMKNSKIGGPTPDLGNVFGLNENMSINTAGMSEAMLIANNTIGFDATGVFIPNAKGTGIYANGINCVLTIQDNTIGGQAKGIALRDVDKGFTIKRNKIGFGSSPSQNYGNSEVGIEIDNCSGGTIGTALASDFNTISYNTDGILILNSYPITITKNTIYCNTRFPIRHQNVDVSKITAPAVTSITAGGVSGTTSPNGVIEVFGNHECSGCQGKIYLGNVVASSSGSFAYTGPMASAVTITGTNTDGATSAFTSPILNDLAKQIVDEQCGSGNGSIKNIQVTDATSYRWFNASNALVASTQDLINVKAGFYYLIAGQIGGCEVISPTYEIKKIDIAYKVRNAMLTGSACGKTNGSIIVTSFETTVPTGFSWLDANDAEVSKDRNLIGAPPGTYRLFGDNGLGCKTLAGTFTIDPTTDLVINASKSSILNTDCAKDEGSIVNVSINGGTAPLSYQWFDENDQVVGTKLDLLNVVSGTYYLKITDVKGCIVQSDAFVIPPSPFNAKIADTFSPNGDGINDVWRIPGLTGLSDFEIKIFNRNGSVVFYTKNQAKDFDGKYNNVDLPVGVYYYTIELKNNNCKGLNGSIMLIR